MLPFIQPTHDALITSLVQTKLCLRRLRRRYLRGSFNFPVYEESTPPLPSTSKERRRHHALLPAHLPDTAPLPDPVISLLLFLTALLVRAWGIAYPDSVVFDEVHFLRFTKAYYYGEYFFDIHPPLGKLIFWAVTVLFCGAPTLKNDINGELFGDQTYTPLRWCSALFGAATAPIVYLISREMGLCVLAALVPAIAYVFEHLHVVESRLVLMDPMLITLMALCLLFALRLWGARKGTPRRVFYLVATALAGVAAISVKWTALATPALVALVSLFGVPFPREGRLKWVEMGVAGALAIVAYVLLFGVHFWMLPKSGQGDAFMRREFQMTLKGGKYYKEGYGGPGFLNNFFYLNREMYAANARIKVRHHWESKWWQWIVNQRGILYFNELAEGEDSGKMRKIYLILNPAVSVITVASLVGFLVIALVIYIPRRRNGRLGKKSRLPGFVARGTFLFAGYFVNILPYLEVSRCTFLYHYLPPLFYALLSTANLIDLVPRIRTQRAVAVLIIVAIVFAYWVWKPWIYAQPLSMKQERWRQLYGEHWQ